MYIYKIVFWLVIVVLSVMSCKNQEVTGTYFLSPVSYVIISKNEDQKLQLVHLYIVGNDSLSFFGSPMMEFKNKFDKKFFKNEKFNASVQFINDTIVIYEYTKLAGEIDEVFFLRKNTINKLYSFIDRYCDDLKDSTNIYEIDNNFDGLVFLIFGQGEDKKILLDEGLVFFTKKELDLSLTMCKQYHLRKNSKLLNLSWTKDINFEDPDLAINDGLIWGLNCGPYLDVLSKTGTTGEVLVFDVRRDR